MYSRNDVLQLLLGVKIITGAQVQQREIAMDLHHPKLGKLPVMMRSSCAEPPQLLHRHGVVHECFASVPLSAHTHFHFDFAIPFNSQISHALNIAMVSVVGANQQATCMSCDSWQ